LISLRAENRTLFIKDVVLRGQLIKIIGQHIGMKTVQDRWNYLAKL
jgi:hypothetical protein